MTERSGRYGWLPVLVERALEGPPTKRNGHEMDTLKRIASYLRAVARKEKQHE